MLNRSSGIKQSFLKTILRLSFIFASLALVQCGKNGAPDAVVYPLPEGVMLENEVWQVVGEGYVYTDSPAVDKDGTLYYADVTGYQIIREEPDGSLSVFEDNSGGSQGMMFGSDGLLYVCRNREGKFVSYQADGTRKDLYEDKTYQVIGKPNAEPEFCNDMLVTSGGDIYYTDRANQQVLILRTGQKPEVVASGYRPNGIALSSDETRLYTTDSIDHRLWAFDVQPDGSLKELENFFDPVYRTNSFGANFRTKGGPGSNGMAVDDDDRVYVTSFVGIIVYSAEGTVQGVIPWPDGFVSNMTFGGPDFDTLYLTGVNKVYKRKMNVTSIPSRFEPSD
jgi:gluconolactonase